MSRTTSAASPALARLRDSLRTLREPLIAHPVLASIETIDDLRIFAEHHVFAVWDELSLLKAIQRRVTCVIEPWVPCGDGDIRRIVNEIVLDEECGCDPASGYTSRFESYRDAMTHCGADTNAIDTFIDLLISGQAVRSALHECSAPPAAMRFVLRTFEIISSDMPHRIAAAYAFGRGDITTAMFGTMAAHLNGTFPDRIGPLRDYFNQMAQASAEQRSARDFKLLARLCNGTPTRWRQAEESAACALTARQVFWDEVLGEIQAARSAVA